MFNLNDPRWGRGDDKQSENNRPDPQKPEGNGRRGPNQGPPDLDELWRDFNRKLGGLFGGARGAVPTTAAASAAVAATSSPT